MKKGKKRSAIKLFFILFFILIVALGLFNKKKTMPIDSESNRSDSVTKKEAKIKKKKQVAMDYQDINLDKKLVALHAKIGNPVFIRIFKKEALLEVWIRTAESYKHLKTYPICAFSGHLGPKLKQGDKQSPEGFYVVTKGSLNPNSRFHLSFNLGFPNTYDRAHKRTGSYLMVHGACASVGCYAMTDSKIEEIYALVEGALKNGQKYVRVHAFPFRMSDINMLAYSNNKWYDFWTDLKEGYDYFEAEKLPPNVKVENGHYAIYEANE